MDVEKLLSTDTRTGDRISSCGSLHFTYAGGIKGNIKFYLNKNRLDAKMPEALLQAAAALIAEYDEQLKEKPF